LVIFEKPVSGQTQNLDNNTSRVKAIPTNLKFNFIVDMYSNNNLSGARAVVPIVFSYIVPAQPVTLQGIMQGLDNFIADPVGSTGEFLVGNWFLLVILIVFILVISLIYANFKGGGGVNISFGNKQGA
jgi:hypothetical protein